MAARASLGHHSRGSGMLEPERAIKRNPTVKTAFTGSRLRCVGFQYQARDIAVKVTS